MAASPPVLDRRRRLFVDLADVEARQNVRRLFHRAEKHGRHPVLAQQAPWERHSGMTASVIHDAEEGLYKCWYMTGMYGEGIGHVQCLATSADGVHWDRPELGLHEALGSRANNIVIPADYHAGKDHWETMLKDPLPGPPEARYKALGWSSYDWDGPLAGIYTATSPDGLRWSHSPEPVFRYHPRPGTGDLGPVGDAQSLMVDPARRRYVAFLRGQGSRLLSTSEDFRTWTPPAPFLYPLHEEEALYNNTGFAYGAHYLGFLTHFDKGPLAQTQVLRLLTSRDGERWDRVPGEPLVGLGEVGEWDRFQIMLTGAPPVPVGDRLHIYYRGTARRHAKVAREYDPRIAEDQDRRTMSIGLATLRLDGFASVGASYDGGWLETRPFALAGDRIMVNAVADYGELRVELRDESGAVIEGFGAGDCAPVGADSTAAAVAWQHGPSVEPLRQRPVRLRFLLKNARLYSYWAE
ncbi:MAG: hypothetical protein ABIL09_05845 [Gemmatimonadota bacterium]